MLLTMVSVFDRFQPLLSKVVASKMAEVIEWSPFASARAVQPPAWKGRCGYSKRLGKLSRVE